MARKGGNKGKAGADGGRQSGGRKAATGKRAGTVAVNALNGLDSDSDDEQQQLDAFQERRDKVSLRVSDSEEELDDDLHGVMDLDEDEDGDSDIDEDEDDEELDDDELLEREIQRGGKLGQMAKQAKQLAQKLKLQKGELESEDEEEDEEDEEQSAAKGKKGKKKGGAADEEDDGPLSWGAAKRAYYDDGSEEPEDEEDAAAEEREVIRLQRELAKKTSAADYGLDEDSEDEGGEDEDEEESEEDDDGTLGAAARKAVAKGKAQTAGGQKGGVAVETVAKQLDALTADERTAAVLADAPELAALVEELTTALHEVRHRIGPLVAEVRGGKFTTKEGLSYLEAKHLLLLQYALHIVFYLLLKAEGKSVKDHPVIARLVEIRAYLEKIRPIDKQLAYQVDKLLRAAAAAQSADAKANGAAGDDDDEDELAAAPRPDRLVSRAQAASAGEPEDVDGDLEGAAGGRTGRLGGGTGVYKPPKLNPVSMEMDEDKKRSGGMSRDDRRLLAEARRRAAQSETLADLAAEVADAPEERRTALPGFDTMAALRQKHKLAARAEEEEDAFIRVPLSRDQAKALKASRRAGFSTAAVMGDFADEVAGLVAASAGMDGDAAEPGSARGLAGVFAKQRVSQKFGGEAAAPKLHGGDQDLPRRATLGERRAAYDAVAAKRSARAGDDFGEGDDDDYDLAPGKKRSGKRAAPDGEEDDFYSEAKAAAAERKRARAASHRAPELLPPMPDPTQEGARPIPYEIQKNRGLTPHRRKDIKNPRKHQRVKFQKALVRRAGQVQDGSKNRDTGRAAYGGEATGVKSRVAKSRRL